MYPSCFVLAPRTSAISFATLGFSAMHTIMYTKVIKSLVNQYGIDSDNFAFTTIVYKIVYSCLTLTAGAFKLQERMKLLNCGILENIAIFTDYNTGVTQKIIFGERYFTSTFRTRVKGSIINSRIFIPAHHSICKDFCSIMLFHREV